MSKNKYDYKGDLQASELLKNNSICIIENGKIRNLKENEKSKMLVHVDNWLKEDGENDYIKEGECVRYRVMYKE